MNWDQMSDKEKIEALQNRISLVEGTLFLLREKFGSNFEGLAAVLQGLGERVQALETAPKS